MATGYDSSKDVLLGTVGEIVVGKSKFRVAVWKYDTKGQPKVALETVVGFDENGNERWMLHKGRIPVDVYEFLASKLSKVKALLSPKDEEDEDEEEVDQEAAASVVNNVATKKGGIKFKVKK